MLKYLKNTISHGLLFERSDSKITNLTGFVDSDWASDSNDRRSYTGFLFLFGKAPVSWETRKQKTVALSSNEAEYMAMSDASREALFLKSVFSELGFAIECTLFNDNQSAQKLAKNHICKGRSKHIDVRHHFIRDVLAEKHVTLKYLPSEEMLADVMTKPLSSQQHFKCLNGFNLVNRV